MIQVIISPHRFSLLMAVDGANKFSHSRVRRLGLYDVSIPA